LGFGRISTSQGSSTERSEAAEKLGAEFPFVRVDFYDAGRPIFGAMNFYPDSGLHDFRSRSADEEIGGLWPVPLPTVSH